MGGRAAGRKSGPGRREPVRSQKRGVSDRSGRGEERQTGPGRREPVRSQKRGAPDRIREKRNPAG